MRGLMRSAVLAGAVAVMLSSGMGVADASPPRLARASHRGDGLSRCSSLQVSTTTTTSTIMRTAAAIHAAR
jgi:hypothetical protein